MKKSPRKLICHTLSLDAAWELDVIHGFGYESTAEKAK
jgi:hypothetical protein